MTSAGTYSLERERLTTERQIALIRLMLAFSSALILVKYYFDQSDPLRGFTMPISAILLMGGFVAYSMIAWVAVRYFSGYGKIFMAVSSVLEIVLISLLVALPSGGDIPFYLLYIFYVVSVAIRYGWQFSIMALSASIISWTAILIFFTSRNEDTLINIPVQLGFTSFLLILAYMFGQVSERQLSYQASLSVVNEFRAELAGLASSSEIIRHLILRTRELLNAEDVFFLPARRGADASEAPGLRSSGADPRMLASFREGGGGWNVESILNEQRPLLSNRPARDALFQKELAQRLNIKNIIAMPMMVRGVPVGVLYVANRRDRAFRSSDMQMVELISTQAAPVIENAVLWERLTESAASEERLRIARDLHDNVLQTLAGIKLHLERCKLLVQKDQGRAIEGIDRIHEIATRGLAEVRAYLSELRIMGPDPARFREAVRRCAEDAAAKGGFSYSLDFDVPEDGLPPNVAAAAFQISRELLTNIATHAQARHANVEISAGDGRLVMEFTDDGKGFDVARVRAEKAAQGHLGLVGVEERARHVGGTLTIISKPGAGTRTIVNIPFGDISS